MRLPNTDLDVHPICLGAAGWGTAATLEESQRLLDIYLETGGNFFDTAHCYAIWVEGGLGLSERVLGKLVTPIRDRVVLATKGGHPDAGPSYPRPDRFLDPAVIHRDIEESLERLGTDVIDLYYLHRDDGKTPVDEIVDALNREPAIRYFGASNWSIRRVEEANVYANANGLKGFVALQNQWSLATPIWVPTDDPTVRYVTEEDARWLAGSGIACIPYSSTANGYFATGGAIDLYQTETNRHRLLRAQRLARELGVTASQVAVAWLMAQEFPVVPIVGSTNPDHLRDALGAIGVTLTSEQRDALATTTE